MDNIRYNSYSIIVPSFNRQDELAELLASMDTSISHDQNSK